MLRSGQQQQAAVGKTRPSAGMHHPEHTASSSSLGRAGRVLSKHRNHRGLILNSASLCFLLPKSKAPASAAHACSSQLEGQQAFVHPVRKQEGTPTEGKKQEHGLRFHTQGWWKLNGPSGHGVLLHWDSLEMAAYKRTVSQLRRASSHKRQQHPQLHLLG